MSEQSLAETAVIVLAAVRAMDAKINNSHESRHVVRALRRNAEQILADAFRRAGDLVYIADDVRKTIDDQCGKAPSEP
jgi:hypothetical protein